MSNAVRKAALDGDASSIRCETAVCPRIGRTVDGGSRGFRRFERKRQRRHWNAWVDDDCVFDVPPLPSSLSSSSHQSSVKLAANQETPLTVPTSTDAPILRLSQENDEKDVGAAVGIHDAPESRPPRVPSLPSSLPRLLAQRELSGGIIGTSAEGGGGGFLGAASPSLSRLLQRTSSRHRIVTWQRHVMVWLATTTCGGTQEESDVGGRQRILLPNGRSSTQRATGRFEFRDLVRRKIPFTQLGTPPLAAVLGLERFGSYCLALGDLDHPSTETDDHWSGRGPPSMIACLALRLYGIPSPAALHQRSVAAFRRRNVDRGSIGMTPLLLTIPLHRAPYEEFLSLTARIPTSLCISSDWTLGVARLKMTSSSILNSNCLHSIIVFPLPGCFPRSTDETRAVATLRLDPASASLYPSPSNLRKSLWKVDHLPAAGFPSARGASTLIKSPGYLLLIRQNNHSCYRLTWIQNVSFRQVVELENHHEHFLLSEQSTTYVVDRPIAGSDCGSPSLLTPVLDPGWRECWSDRYTGIDQPPNGASGWSPGDDDSSAAALSPKYPHPQPLRVAGEAWLRWDAVLADVLNRRPKFVTTGGRDVGAIIHLPPFACDIVQVSDGGRSVQGVICFDSGKKMMYAVFVEVDLFSPGSYREVKWTRRERSSLGEPLDMLCETLSLNQRMSLERIGPYGQVPEPLRDWSSLCTNRSVEPDEWTVRAEDPRCRERWRPLLLSASSEVGPVGTIPYDAVYPDTQVFDNRAVISHVPVRSLRSRSTGLELVYG